MCSVFKRGHKFFFFNFIEHALSGNRRVEQHLRLIRVPGPPGVRPGQLRRQGRRQVVILYNGSALLFVLRKLLVQADARSEDGLE